VARVKAAHGLIDVLVAAAAHLAERRHGAFPAGSSLRPEWLERLSPYPRTGRPLDRHSERFVPFLQRLR
jgi:hypothetical protein